MAAYRIGNNWRKRSSEGRKRKGGAALLGPSGRVKTAQPFHVKHIGLHEQV